MDYLIKVEIAADTDEVSRERIEKNLNGGTMRLAVFPREKMAVGLTDGTKIAILDVLVLQKNEFTADALAVVKPWQPFN